MFSWILGLSVAWACTGDVAGKVVGFGADGKTVLVRFEATPDSGPGALDLATFELQHGQELRRWPILRFEDKGSQTVRSSRWKDAEAELKALGVVLTPDLAPFIGDDVEPLATLVPGTDAVVAAGKVMSGAGDEAMATLAVSIARPGLKPTLTSLGSWGWSNNANAWTTIQGAWVTPARDKVVFIAGVSCVEPRVVVAAVPK